MRTCPISGKPMTRSSIGGVEVDLSDHGVWLDKGELYLITEKLRHEEPSWMVSDLFRRESKPPVDPERRLACPVCGATMELVKHHGVHLDWCREHGVWLDDGELDALQNNLRLDPLFVGKIATRLWEARY
ncbi:MAG: zf-TFIIB domain-containing protein [Alphaproteobacteria bacterium]|nr:zf-TFIIB domain-containing protein [Alphaproteobacteria bacterium]